MSDHFVPLSAVASGSDARTIGGRVKVLPRAQAAQQPVATTSAPAVQSARVVASAACLSQPKIELQREGDRITRIQVFCSCGQLIELDCHSQG